MSWLFVVGYFTLVVFIVLMFGLVVDAPQKRKKQQEAFLKASSVHQDGVWPPAPATYSEPPEPEPWAWCLLCHRVSTMAAISDNDGHCQYADCSASTRDMVAWCDLRMRTAELPEEPEVGTVYANLVRVKEAEPGSA